MKSFSSFLPIVAVVAIVGCSTKPQYSMNDAQEVFNAFTNIDASLDVGVNFSKYTDSVIAAKVAIEKYKTSDKANPNALPLFEKALTGYMSGLNYWKCYIDLSEKTSPINAQQICQDDEIKKLSLVYPIILENEGVKSAIKKGIEKDLPFSFFLDRKGTLSLIWLTSKGAVSDAKTVFTSK